MYVLCQFMRDAAASTNVVTTCALVTLAIALGLGAERLRVWKYSGMFATLYYSDGVAFSSEPEGPLAARLV